MTHEIESTGNCKPWSSINTTDMTHETESTANCKPPLSMFTSFTIDFVCSVLVCDMLPDLVWVWFYCFAPFCLDDLTQNESPWIRVFGPIFSEPLLQFSVQTSSSHFHTDRLIVLRSFPLKRFTLLHKCSLKGPFPLKYEIGYRWLVSCFPKIPPWLSAETLTPTLQRPHNSGVHLTKASQESKQSSSHTALSRTKIQVQTTSQTAYATGRLKTHEQKNLLHSKWKKGRTRANPDPTLEAAVAARTKQFKQTAREAKLAKYRNFRADCRTETTVTQLWQLYRQMQGNGCTQTTPDLKDTNGTRPTKRRSGLAWAIPATEQPKRLWRQEAHTEWPCYFFAGAAHSHEAAPAKK